MHLNNSLTKTNDKKVTLFIRRIEVTEVEQPCKIFNHIVQTPAQMEATLN